MRLDVKSVDHVLTRLPFAAEAIQTGNGAEFQSAFHRHVQDKGIRHVRIKPRTHQLDGKASSAHTASTPSLVNVSRVKFFKITHRHVVRQGRPAVTPPA